MKKNVKKSIFDLDKDWIDQVRVNLSAVERRTTSLTKRRTVKKEYQVAWLLKAITLLDLTTLSGDDTFGKVEKLCIKGLNPISDLILTQLKIQNGTINVGAICVYHDLVANAKKQLAESKARFEEKGTEVVLDVFQHLELDYIQSAEKAGFTLLEKKDWYDDETDLPRLISFLFEKPK